MVYSDYKYIAIWLVQKWRLDIDYKEDKIEH